MLSDCLPRQPRILSRNIEESNFFEFSDDSSFAAVLCYINFSLIFKNQFFFVYLKYLLLNLYLPSEFYMFLHVSDTQIRVFVLLILQDGFFYFMIILYQCIDDYNATHLLLWLLLHFPPLFGCH